jgi:hypothetical protein
VENDIFSNSRPVTAPAVGPTRILYRLKFLLTHIPDTRYKRKEKPERKEIHACEKYVKENQICIKEKREKGILKPFR